MIPHLCGPNRVRRRKRATRGSALGLALLGLMMALLPACGQPIGAPAEEALRVYSFGLARMLPADNDSLPDGVGVARNSDETNRMVYVDFDADPALRWQSEPLAEETGSSLNALAANRSLVVMAYEDTLIAFDRQAGTLLWEVVLSDHVLHYCEDCLQFIGNRLVALTADGALNGINTETGERGWAVWLNETPHQLLNLAGKAGVLDSEGDTVGIDVYDPLTGIRVERVVPQCPNEIFPERPQTLGIYDPLLLSGDGAYLYVAMSMYEPGCLQKWDTATLTEVWQATMPSEVLDELDSWTYLGEPYLLTEEALILSEGHHLSTVDLSDGVWAEVFGDTDHNLSPLAMQGDTLVILAERTRGTRQFSLWGIDVAAGVPRWRFDPTAEEIYEEGSAVVYEDGIWSASMSSGRVVVLEAFSDPNYLTFTVLNPTDGSQVATNRLTLGDGTSVYWVEVLGWFHEQIYLELDGRLRVIDSTTAAEVAAWP